MISDQFLGLLNFLGVIVVICVGWLALMVATWMVTMTLSKVIYISLNHVTRDALKIWNIRRLKFWLARMESEGLIDTPSFYRDLVVQKKPRTLDDFMELNDITVYHEQQELNKGDEPEPHQPT